MEGGGMQSMIRSLVLMFIAVGLVAVPLACGQGGATGAIDGTVLDVSRRCGG